MSHNPSLATLQGGEEGENGQVVVVNNVTVSVPVTDVCGDVNAQYIHIVCGHCYITTHVLPVMLYSMDCSTHF